ncbi:HAMP domain-containing protein [bacterium]|nr:HAMP domain-containing protein [bacterium]
MIRHIQTNLSLRIATFLVLGLGLLMSALCAFFISTAAQKMEYNLLLKGKGMARQGAAVVAELLSTGIRDGKLSADEAFDESYQAIAGSETAKYRTRFVAFTDLALPRVQDVFMKDPDILFAAAADRNGYIGTHNNPERSKRRFDDPIGLKAAQNTEAAGLVQLYHRDTGEWAWDISSPITIEGRHWGAFRVGFSKARLDGQIRDFVLTMASASVVVIALLSAFVFWLLRRALRPLDHMVRVVEAVSHGDLRHNVEVRSADEIGKMAASLQRMIASLRQVVGTVRGAAHVVEGGVSEISASAEEMSRASQSQAAAAEETSSSMDEMAAAIQQVAGNAQTLAQSVDDTSSAIEQMMASIRHVAGNSDNLNSAVSETSAAIEEMAASIQQVARNIEETHQVAGHASEAAREGQQAVEKTVAGMTNVSQVMGEVIHAIEGLGKRSGEIGAIVEVIDDIAEQTNLLALNAAIEAARAGEAGRGFAVVADEVRKLAERSAKATKEIAELIKGIQRETQHAIESSDRGEHAIREGVTLAQAAGQSLSAIVGSVERAGVLMGQIAQASQEQANAAEQITGAVANMSHLTQQVTSATREEAVGSEQIVRATDVMNQMTHQVSEATSEQKKGGERIVLAAENVSRAAQEASEATRLIAQASGGLQAQATTLLDAIAFFKLDDAHERTQRVPAAEKSVPMLKA